MIFILFFCFCLRFFHSFVFCGQTASALASRRNTFDTSLCHRIMNETMRTIEKENHGGNCLTFERRSSTSPLSRHSQMINRQFFIFIFFPCGACVWVCMCVQLYVPYATYATHIGSMKNCALFLLVLGIIT